MRLLPSLALSALLLSSTQAYAGGFYIADIGARALARGGAFVAAPDSPLAIHYNPAGLSLLKGLHTEVSLSLVTYEMRFNRSCPCTASTNPNAAMLDAELQKTFDANPAQSNTPLPIPFIGVSYGIEPLDLSFGLAVWGPNSGRHDYGVLPGASSPNFSDLAAAKASRYNALEAANLEVNYALAVSLTPLKGIANGLFDGLRIGGGLYLYQSGANQSLHLWADTSLATTPEDSRFDVPLVLDFTSDISFNYGAGISWDLPFLEGLSLGGSFRAARDITANGSITVNRTRFLISDLMAEINGDEVVVKLETAPLIRGGLQYRHDNVFRAEAAMVWEGWSVHDRIVITPQNISFSAPILSEPVVLGDIVSERHWEDTYSIRVGGELNLFEPLLGVRAGYFYEPSAIPTERLDPSRVDLDKHGFAMGLSTSMYGFNLEVSAMYVALSSVTVTDSKASIIAPLGFAPDYLTTIGNGSYDGYYFIGSASLSFNLDLFLES